MRAAYERPGRVAIAQRLETFVTCSRCMRSILAGEPVRRDHGDWYHAQCVREPGIAGNGGHMSSETEPHEEAPAVLCVICGTGIQTAVDLEVTEAGPVHVRCRPEPD